MTWQPGKWPFPGETPLQIARQVARAYRMHLVNAAPDEAALADETMMRFGQLWVIPGVEHYTDDQEITADLAAALVNRSESIIRKWAITDHPHREGEPLLPRHGWSGKRRTYLVGDVKHAAEVAEEMFTGRRRDTKPDHSDHVADLP